LIISHGILIKLKKDGGIQNCGSEIMTGIKMTSRPNHLASFFLRNGLDFIKHGEILHPTPCKGAPTRK
jgi:hypothetical protein